MNARNRIKPLLTLCCALLLVAAVGVAAHLGAGIALGNGIVGGLHLLEVLFGGQQHLHRRQREDHAGRGQGDHRRHACGGR